MMDVRDLIPWAALSKPQGGGDGPSVGRCVRSSRAVVVYLTISDKWSTNQIAPFDSFVSIFSIHITCRSFDSVVVFDVVVVVVCVFTRHFSSQLEMYHPLSYPY